MRTHRLVLILAAVLALASRGALADPNTAKAETLFNQGRTLLQAGKLAQACEAFDASMKLAPATTTLFNQADCREKNGQLATAWRLFGQGERATRGTVDGVGKKLHQVAVDRIGSLQLRLSHVTITVPSPSDGLVVNRDDTAVPPAEWNHPQPIDAGTYTFTALRGDRGVWSETITIGIAGDDQTVSVVEQRPRKVDAAASPPPAPTAAVPDVHDAREAPVHADLRATAEPPSRTNAWLATVGAAALLGGALAFDLWGNSTYADAQAQNSMDLWSSANDKRYVAEGLLGVGLACGGLAAYLWLHDDHEAKHAIVTPVVAPGTAGVQLGGSF